MCPCEEEKEQTTNHLIFHSKILCSQRNEMIKNKKKKTLVAIGLPRMKR